MPIIVFHGHACFEVIDSEGRSIVIDPHDGGSIGLPRPEARADAVLVTHNHFDHNAVEVVLKPGGEKHIMRKGEFVVLGKHRARGIEAYHDPYKGRMRGKVVMYVVEVDGVRILHVGDLGHTLTEDHVRAIGKVDVVMAPVGGTFTIGPKEAAEVLRTLRPKAFIPMHYWVPGVNLPLKPLDEFLKVVEDEYEVVRVGSNRFDTSGVGWEGTKVVVLEAPRK